MLLVLSMFFAMLPIPAMADAMKNGNEQNGNEQNGIIVVLRVNTSGKQVQSFGAGSILVTIPYIY